MFFRRRIAFRQFQNRIAGIAAVSLAALLPMQAQSQQISTQSGLAAGVNLAQAARQLNMQDMYARALYLHIRGNPALLDNQQFYVGFLAYLMSTTEGFDCGQAFGNEFERRDYFTRAFALKDQLREIVSTVNIPQRFDISYTIDTGRYDFTSTTLPFSNITSIGSVLSRSISSQNARYCAQQMLEGTTVDISLFPWQFQVVNEAVKPETPGFPFGRSLQISANDARILFERFGRQLYGSVSYLFQAANNGEQKIQVIPTDGQLFGLANDAVVRVKSFSHPQLSQPSYLDITNPLAISIPVLGLNADLKFTQEGFRAVGSGTRKDKGTDITIGGEFPVDGSAAVANSTFIMRLAVPQLIGRAQGLPNTQGAQRFLTLFGAIDFGKVSNLRAPVSGSAIVLQVEPDGNLRNSGAMAFTGAFRPTEEAAPAAAAPEASQLEESPQQASTSGN